MRVLLSKFPPDIIERYNSEKKVAADGCVYIKIKKGMYGLKQAAILAYVQLTEFLERLGYFPEPHCMGLWSHKTQKTKFCLCVEDFGIKYHSQDNANYLLSCLKQHYKISTNWTGTNCCGLTLEWDFDNHWVDISMPNYVKKQLGR